MSQDLLALRAEVARLRTCITKAVIASGDPEDADAVTPESLVGIVRGLLEDCHRAEEAEDNARAEAAALREECAALSRTLSDMNACTVESERAIAAEERAAVAKYLQERAAFFRQRAEEPGHHIDTITRDDARARVLEDAAQVVAAGAHHEEREGAPAKASADDAAILREKRDAIVKELGPAIIPTLTVTKTGSYSGDPCAQCGAMTVVEGRACTTCGRKVREGGR